MSFFDKINYYMIVDTLQVNGILSMPCLQLTDKLPLYT